MKMAKRKAPALRGRFDVISMQMQFLSELSCRNTKFACIPRFQPLPYRISQKGCILFTHIHRVPFFSLIFGRKFRREIDIALRYREMHACVQKMGQRNRLFFITSLFYLFFLSWISKR